MFAMPAPPPVDFKTDIFEQIYMDEKYNPYTEFEGMGAHGSLIYIEDESVHGPAGKVPIYYFSQKDPEFKDLEFGQGTIETSACGPTSLSMAMSTLLQTEVHPTETAAVALDKNFVREKGIEWAYFDYVGEKSKYVDVSNINFSEKTFTETLDKDGIIILSGRSKDPDSPFTKSGHVISIVGYKETEDGIRFLVADPNEYKEKSLSKTEGVQEFGWETFKHGNVGFCKSVTLENGESLKSIPDVEDVVRFGMNSISDVRSQMLIRSFGTESELTIKSLEDPNIYSHITETRNIPVMSMLYANNLLDRISYGQDIFKDVLSKFENEGKIDKGVDTNEFSEDKVDFVKGAREFDDKADAIAWELDD